MTLAEKKSYVLKYIRLGMDPFSSMICAECSDEEMASLDSDSDFQRQCRLVTKLEEMRMLEGFERARANNLALNDTRDTRWMLEKMHPERFGSGFKKANGKNGVNIQIDFGDGGDLDDNVETFEGEGNEDLS